MMNWVLLLDPLKRRSVAPMVGPLQARLSRLALRRFPEGEFLVAVDDAMERGSIKAINAGWNRYIFS